MAVFRKIHISFWEDTFVETLTPEQKYFYLYLLTNKKTRQCGIYEISKRQMSFDTGYTVEVVGKLLKFFGEKRKIVFNVETSEIVILNWLKYNDSTSPKVRACIEKELMEVKNRALIEYLYGNGKVPEHLPDGSETHPQEEKEKEEKQEKEKKKTSGFVPPTLEEVQHYFMEKGYTEHAAAKAFEYYSLADWRDSKGNRVLNWKQKMIAVWFKDENRRQLVNRGGHYNISATSTLLCRQPNFKDEW